MKEKYKTITDGEWHPVVMSGDKSMCCDCGLVHHLKYKIVKGVLYVKATRDYRATGQARRWKFRKREKNLVETPKQTTTIKQVPFLGTIYSWMMEYCPLIHMKTIQSYVSDVPCASCTCHIISSEWCKVEATFIRKEDYEAFTKYMKKIFRREAFRKAS